MKLYQDTTIQCSLDKFKDLEKNADVQFKNCVFYIRNVDTEAGLVNNMLNDGEKFIDCFVHYIGRSGDAGHMSYRGKGAVNVDNEHRTINLNLGDDLKVDEEGNLGLNFDFGSEFSKLGTLSLNLDSKGALITDTERGIRVNVKRGGVDVNQATNKVEAKFYDSSLAEKECDIEHQDREYGMYVNTDQEHGIKTTDKGVGINLYTRLDTNESGLEFTAIKGDESGLKVNPGNGVYISSGKVALNVDTNTGLDASGLRLTTKIDANTPAQFSDAYVAPTQQQSEPGNTKATDTGKNPTNKTPAELAELNGVYSADHVDNSMEYKNGVLAARRQNPLETMELGPGLSKSVQDRTLYLNLNDEVITTYNGYLTTNTHHGITKNNNGIYIDTRSDSGLTTEARNIEVNGEQVQDTSLRVKLPDTSGLQTDSTGLSIKRAQKEGSNTYASGLTIDSKGIKLAYDTTQFLLDGNDLKLQMDSSAPVKFNEGLTLELDKGQTFLDIQSGKLTTKIDSDVFTQTTGVLNLNYDKPLYVNNKKLDIFRTDSMLKVGTGSETGLVLKPSKGALYLPVKENTGLVFTNDKLQIDIGDGLTMSGTKITAPARDPVVYLKGHDALFHKGIYFVEDTQGYDGVSHDMLSVVLAENSGLTFANSATQRNNDTTYVEGLQINPDKPLYLNKSDKLALYYDVARGIGNDTDGNTPKGLYLKTSAPFSFIETSGENYGKLKLNVSTPLKIDNTLKIDTDDYTVYQSDSKKLAVKIIDKKGLASKNTNDAKGMYVDIDENTMEYTSLGAIKAKTQNPITAISTDNLYGTGLHIAKINDKDVLDVKLAEKSPGLSSTSGLAVVAGNGITVGSDVAVNALSPLVSNTSGVSLSVEGALVAGTNLHLALNEGQFKEEAPQDSTQQKLHIITGNGITTSGGICVQADDAGPISVGAGGVNLRTGAGIQLVDDNESKKEIALKHAPYFSSDTTAGLSLKVGNGLKTQENNEDLGTLQLDVDNSTMLFTGTKLTAKTIIQPSNTISVENDNKPSVIAGEGIIADVGGVSVNTGLSTKIMNNRVEVNPEGFMSSSVYLTDGNSLGVKTYDNTLTSHELGLARDCIERSSFVCGDYIVFVGGKSASVNYYDDIDVYYCAADGSLTRVQQYSTTRLNTAKSKVKGVYMSVSSNAIDGYLLLAGGRNADVDTYAQVFTMKDGVLNQVKEPQNLGEVKSCMGYNGNFYLQVGEIIRKYTAELNPVGGPMIQNVNVSCSSKTALYFQKKDKTMGYYLYSSSEITNSSQPSELFDEMVFGDATYCIKGSNVYKFGTYTTSISFTSYATDTTALYIYQNPKIKKIVNGTVNSQYDVGEISISSFVRMKNLSVLSSGKQILSYSNGTKKYQCGDIFGLGVNTGPGLKATDNGVEVKLAPYSGVSIGADGVDIASSLAGTGLKFNQGTATATDTTPSTLAVNYGTGLTIGTESTDKDKLVVNYGTGLKVPSSGNDKDKLVVNAEDLKGTHLKVESGKLAVNVNTGTTSLLQNKSGVLDLPLTQYRHPGDTSTKGVFTKTDAGFYPNASFFTGPGIKAVDNVNTLYNGNTATSNKAQGLSLDLATSGGLTFTSNQVKVKAADMTGAGITTEGDSAGVKLAVNYGAGLEIPSSGDDKDKLQVKSADTALHAGADGVSLLTTTGLGRDDNGKLTIQPEVLSGPGIKAENGHLALDVGNGLTVERRGLRKNAESIDALISTVRDGVEYILYFSHGCQQAFRWDGEQLFEIWHTDDEYVSGAKVDAIVIKNKVYVGWCIFNMSEGGIIDHHIIEYSFDTKTFLKKERDVDQTNNTSMFRLLAYNDELYITRQISNGTGCYLYKFISSLQTGSSLHQFPSRNSARIYKVVVVNGYAYLIGGGVDSAASNLAYRLNMSTLAGESWTMTYGTINPVVLVHGNYIFVYGGTDYSGTALSYLQRIDTTAQNGGIIAVNTGIANGAIWIDGETIRIHGQTGKSFSLNLGEINETDSTSWSAAKIQTITQSGCVDAPVNSNQITHRSGQFQYVSINGQVSGVKVKNGDASIAVNSSGVSVNKATNSGLEITSGQTTNGLAVKTNTKGALKVNSDGVDLDQEAAGNGLAYTAGTSTTTKNRTRLSVKAADQSLSVGSSGVKVHCATNGGLTTVDDSGNTQGLNVKLPTNSGLTADSNGLKVNTSVIQSKLTAGEGINLASNTVSVSGDNTLVSHKMKLSAARWNVVATTFSSGGKEYAVFAGGRKGTANGDILKNVDVFTAEGQSTLVLSSTYTESTAVTLGDTALFGGGTYHDKNGTVCIDSIYLQDGVLTRSEATDFTERHHLAAAVAGDYAFFAGGTNDGDTQVVNTVDVYKVNSSHTPVKQSSSLTLSTARSHLCGATLTTKDGVQYAVFAGGETTVESDGAIGTLSKIVDVFKSNGTKYDGAKVEELYNQRTRGTMTPLEDCVLYGGGWNGETYGKVCKIYLEDGVFKNTFTDNILQPRMDLASTTVGKYAFFAGGWNGNTYNDTVDVVHLVDGTPTLYKTLTLDAPAAFLAGTRLGSLAIFGGGKNADGPVDTITAFRVVGDIVEKVDLNKLALNIAQNSGLSLENGMGVSVDSKSVEVNTEGKIRVKSGAVVAGSGMKTNYASGVHTVSVDLVTNGGLQTHTDADEDKGKLEVKLNPYGAVRADGNGLDIKSTIAGSGLEFTQGSSSANTQLGVKTSKLFKRAAFNLTPINNYSTLIYAGGYIYVFTPTVSYYAKYIGSVPANAFTQLSSFQTFNTSTSYTNLQYIRAFSYDKYIWVAGMTGSTTFSILVYRINSGGSLTKCKKLDKTVNSTATCFAGTIYKGKLLYCLNSAYKLVDCGGNETGFTSGTMFNHVCVFRIRDDVFGVSTGSSNQIVNILDTSKSCQAGSENIVFAGAARDTEDNAIVVVNSSSKFIMGYVKNQNGTPVWFAIKNATGSYPHKRQTVGKHGNYLLTNINDSLYMCYPDNTSQNSYSTGTQFWDFICVPSGIISLGTGYIYYYALSHTYIMSNAVQDTNINPELTPGDGVSIAPDNTIKIKHGLSLERGETLEVNKDMFKPRAGYGLERKLMIGRDPQYPATVQCRDFVFVFYRNAGKAEVYTLDWDFVREVDIPVFVADGTAPVFNSCVQAVSYQETIWVCGAISVSYTGIYTYHVEDDGTLTRIGYSGQFDSDCRRKLNIAYGTCYLSYKSSAYIFHTDGTRSDVSDVNSCSTWFQIGSTTYWCGHTASTSANIYKSSGIIATLGKGIAAASVVKCDESSVIILGWDYSSLSLWWFDSAPSLGARTDISLALTEGEDIPSVHKVGNYVYVVVKGHVYVYTFDPSAHTFSKSSEINLDGIYGNSAITLGDRVYYFKGREIRYILGTAPAPYVDSGDMLCVKAGNGITSDVDGVKVNYGSTLEIPSSGTDKDKLAVKLKSNGGIKNDSGLKVDVDGSTITINSSGKLVGTQQLSGGAGIDLTSNKLKIDLESNCGLKLGTGSGTPGDADKLSVNYGDGLTIDSSGTNANKLRVDYNTVASTLAISSDNRTGLTTGGSKMKVNYGSGLTLSTGTNAGKLIVDTSTIQSKLSAGTGISSTDLSSGTIKVDTSKIQSKLSAGTGISSTDLSSGTIKVDTSKIQSKLSAGTGISSTDLSSGTIKVDTTAIQSKLSAGNGIGLSGSTISVKAINTSLSVESGGVKVNCATNGGLTVNSGLLVDLNALVDNVSVSVNGNGKLCMNSVVFV